MRGSKNIIDWLNKILASELTSIDQYFIHACMYDDWGYKKLHERIHHEMTDEQGHARLLIQRILFLGGSPAMNVREPLKVGSSVPEMLQNDLELEYAAIATLREGIRACEAAQDYTSRQILLTLLRDTEEDHTLWLEQQLGHIAKLGLEKYLMTCI